MQDNLSMDGGNAFLYTLGTIIDKGLIPIFKFFFELIKNSMMKRAKERELKMHSGTFPANELETLATRYGWKLVDIDSPFRFDADMNPIGNYTIKEERHFDSAGKEISKEKKYFNSAGKEISKEEKMVLDKVEFARFRDFKNKACQMNIPHSFIPIKEKIETTKSVPKLGEDGKPMHDESGKPIYENKLVTETIIKYKMYFPDNKILSVNSLITSMGYDISGNDISSSMIDDPSKLLGKEEANVMSDGDVDRNIERCVDDLAKRIEEKYLNPYVLLLEYKTLQEKRNFIDALENEAGVDLNISNEELDKMTKGGLTKKCLDAVKENVYIERMDGIDVENLFTDISTGLGNYELFRGKDGRIVVVDMVDPKCHGAFENVESLVNLCGEFAEGLGIGITKESFADDFKRKLNNDSLIKCINNKKDTVERNFSALDENVVAGMSENCRNFIKCSVICDENFDLSVYKDCKNLYDVTRVADAYNKGINVAKLQKMNAPIANYPAITNAVNLMHTSYDNMSSLYDVKKEDVSKIENALYSGYVDSIKLTPDMINSISGYIEEKSLKDLSQINLDNIAYFCRDRNTEINDKINAYVSDVRSIEKDKVIGSNALSKNIDMARASLEIQVSIGAPEIHDIFTNLNNEYSRGGILSERESLSRKSLVFEDLYSSNNGFTENGTRYAVLQDGNLKEKVPQKAYKNTSYYLSENGDVSCRILLNENLLRDKGDYKFNQYMDELDPYSSFSDKNGNTMNQYVVKSFDEGTLVVNDNGDMTIIRNISEDDYRSNHLSDMGRSRHYEQRDTGNSQYFTNVIPEVSNEKINSYIDGYENEAMKHPNISVKLKENQDYKVVYNRNRDRLEYSKHNEKMNSWVAVKRNDVIRDMAKNDDFKINSSRKNDAKRTENPKSKGKKNDKGR